MPYINSRTGQVVQALPTGGRLIQRQVQQQTSGGGISPFPFIKQGLNLGGKFLGGTGRNVLGGLGSLAGLGLSIANKSPGGIVSSLGSLANFSAPLAQGLGLGTVGSTFGGSLAAGGQALLAGASPIGAGAGAAGTGLAGSLSSIGNLAIPFGAIAGGFSFAKSFTDAKRLKGAQKEFKQGQGIMRRLGEEQAQGLPLAVDDLRFVGFQPNDKSGDIVKDAEDAVATMLNRGQAPQMYKGEYVTPLIVRYSNALEPGSKGQGPSVLEFGEPQQLLVRVPASQILRAPSGRFIGQEAKSETREKRQEAQDRRRERSGRSNRDDRD